MSSVTSLSENPLPSPSPTLCTWPDTQEAAQMGF